MPQDGGYSALVSAAMCGRFDIVKVLLKYGANKDSETEVSPGKLS